MIHRLQSPPGDGEVALPGVEAVPAVRQANRDAFSRMDFPVAGLTGTQLRKLARHDLAGELGLDPDREWVLTGHQPEMHHAGVWFKDAVIAALGEALAGEAVHVVSDLDTLKHAELAIPHVKPNGGIELNRVAFARTPPHRCAAQVAPPTPAMLAELVAAVREALGEREVFEVWAAAASEAPARAGSLADWLAAGRRAASAHLGVFTHDVPLSRLCRAEAFAHFAADVLLRHERMFALHAEALARYRADHGIDGAARPVSDLRRLGSAVEVPLWLYRGDGPRQPLLVQAAGRFLELLGRDGPVGRIPADAPAAAGAMHALAAQGVRIAPRALTLTMFLRCFLADQFVHGLGGAIYDELGDALTRRWYDGWRPPEFLWASATARMDLPVHGATEADLARARWDRHHAWHNPARYADDPDRLEQPPVAGLLHRKRADIRRLASAPRLGPERAEAFCDLHQTNAQLRGLFGDSLDRLERRVQNTAWQLQQNALAGSREYFFALLPTAKLRRLARQARDWAAQAAARQKVEQ